MTAWKGTVLHFLGALLLVTASGCIGDPRTSNQGGGTLLSAGSKLLAGNIRALTADEWQILGDNAPSLASQFGIDLGEFQVPSLTDEQAAAIVDFLNGYEIDTIDELFTAIESGAIDETDIPPELMELI